MGLENETPLIRDARCRRMRKEHEPQWRRDEKGHLVKWMLHFLSTSRQKFNQVKSDLSRSDKRFTMPPYVPKVHQKFDVLLRRRWSTINGWAWDMRRVIVCCVRWDLRMNLIHSLVTNCCLFYLWLPMVFQNMLLLLQFLLIFVYLGELPPWKNMLRNYKIRMRHLYFELCRWSTETECSTRLVRKPKWRLVGFRIRCFRRRCLTYHLVERWRQHYSVHTPTLNGSLVPMSLSRRHCRWRKRKLTGKYHHWKRRVVHHGFFLRVRPVESPIAKAYSEETLAAHCDSTDFLTPMKLFKSFEKDDCQDSAQEVVDQMNRHWTALSLEANSNPGFMRTKFEDWPVVWGTGASYGLPPFVSDFIDYEEVLLPVQDIAHAR